MIYHGLGPRFEADRSAVGFGSLLYLSGSTFLTLGLGGDRQVNGHRSSRQTRSRDDQVKVMLASPET
jgi:hypothetical protein